MTSLKYLSGFTAEEPEGKDVRRTFSQIMITSATSTSASNIARIASIVVEIT
ncbi:MAG: hypothetical protein WC891_06025 [Actinomycetota bacterium]